MFLILLLLFVFRLLPSLLCDLPPPLTTAVSFFLLLPALLPHRTLHFQYLTAFTVSLASECEENKTVETINDKRYSRDEYMVEDINYLSIILLIYCHVSDLHMATLIIT